MHATASTKHLGSGEGWCRIWLSLAADIELMCRACINRPAPVFLPQAAAEHQRKSLRPPVLVAEERQHLFSRGAAMAADVQLVHKALLISIRDLPLALLPLHLPQAGHRLNAHVLPHIHRRWRLAVPPAQRGAAASELFTRLAEPPVLPQGRFPVLGRAWAARLRPGMQSAGTK